LEPGVVDAVGGAVVVVPGALVAAGGAVVVQVAVGAAAVGVAVLCAAAAAAFEASAVVVAAAAQLPENGQAVRCRSKPLRTQCRTQRLHAMACYKLYNSYLSPPNRP